MFFVAMLVRLPGLFQPLWYDEVFSWWVSRLPLDRFVPAVLGDVHPPLFYVIIALLGPNPVVQRFFPLVCWFFTALLLMMLAKNYFPAGSRAPLLVGFIFAFSPFQVFYATELRMYSTLQLLALFMFAAIRAERYWLAGAVAAVAALFHHYGLVYAAAWGAVVAIRELQRGNWLVGAIRQAAPLGLALAALPVGLLQQSGAFAGGHWLWAPSPADVLLLPGEFLFGTPQGSPAASVLMVVLGVAAALLVIVWDWAKAEWWPWLVAPVALAAAISYAWHPVFMARPLIGLAPLFYIALVGAVRGLPRNGRWVVAVVAAPAVVATLILPNAAQVYFSRVNIRDVAKVLGYPLPTNAVIWHNALYPSVEFEQLDLNATQYVYPQPAGLGDGYTAQTRAALGIRESKPEDLPTPPDYVVIYRGYTYLPEADNAARHLVADQAYHLVYQHAQDETEIQIFKRSTNEQP
jgi:hypothetical protein